MSLKSINPTSEETFAEHAVLTDEELASRVRQAEACFLDWRGVPIQERAARLQELAARLRANLQPLAELATREMGKPITQARAEVEKCAWVCEYYAEHGPGFLQPRIVPTSATQSYVRYDPLGPLLAIMPWNFPYWQVFRAAAPALLAGNVVLLKHASNVSGAALEIERLFREAGFPEGAFTTLLLESGRLETLIANPLIRAVTLTGGEPAGRAVGAAAGRNLKRSVLELGGSDPFIVLADADLQAAVEAGIRARCQNNGQSCIAAKRFIVEQSILDEFVELFADGMNSQRIGDPLQDSTELGPLARQDLREALHEQVERSLQQGAELVCGGVLPLQRGYFYPPTVLANVQPGMAAFDEETFGPVAAVIAAEDTDSAIALANQSTLGLGASLWTSQLDRAECLAARLEAGSVFINRMVQSDPHLPFGGIKNSGYGRELSQEGIHEFVNAKTVWLQGPDSV